MRALFFSNPGNLNNDVGNYEKALNNDALVIDTGTYNNPTGVAQYYFRDCEVTQLVGMDGLAISDDALLSAAVDTVNIWDEQTDAEGNNYTLAKMVDLDPDMQFRSSLYGLRIFVKSADGYGFSGSIDITELRDLFNDSGIRFTVAAFAKTAHKVIESNRNTFVFIISMAASI